MKEYGRKPYISESYHDMMSKRSNAANWAIILQKHSEYEKPYRSDTYEEMQHYAPVFPGLSFDVYDFDFGFDPYMPYAPWHIIFDCSTDPCFCKGQTKCSNMGCTYPIVDIKPISGCQGLSFTFGNGQICITATDNPSSFCEVAVIMRARVPFTGDIRSLWKRRYFFVFGTSEKDIDECDDAECCTPDATMAWDSGTSAETVARNNSCTVAITGNNKPFSWSVSGTGFTLDNASTTGLTNTLNADGTACGVATITVTGCDDVVATGYVRCTTGQWVSIYSCGSSQPYGCLVTEGKYKVRTDCHYTSTPGCPDMPDPPCELLCPDDSCVADEPCVKSGDNYFYVRYSQKWEWQCQ